jgi:hypothetical protein
MAREENKQVGPKKETGLRHPLGELSDFTPQESRKIKKLLDPVGGPKSFKDKAIDAGKKVLEIGKKAVEFTPPGQVKKLVELVKDKTKKKTGVIVDKGNNRPSKVNTGPDSNPGSSNPKRAGKKFGGRMGYKDGSKGCKLATKGKGRAYGKNS